MLTRIVFKQGNKIMSNIKKQLSIVLALTKSVSSDIKEWPIAFNINGLWLNQPKIEIQLPYDTSIEDIHAYVMEVINECVSIVPNFNDATYQELANLFTDYFKDNVDVIDKSVRTALGKVEELPHSVARYSDDEYGVTMNIFISETKTEI